MRNHVNDRFDDYLAGELNLDALRNFERHIDNCRSCAKELAETEDARSCLQWLLPLESPPEPGPEFYARVQSSIEKKMDSGWFGSLASALQAPRLAYPLLFLFLGLLFTAWTMTSGTEWNETSVLGIPPARFSGSISTEADRMHNRDLVMISLVENIDGEQ